VLFSAFLQLQETAWDGGLCLSLRVSEGLSLPREAATWVISYLAKRGAGKTYCSSVQAEEMLKAGIPIVVIDGMGIWWGLRVSADGLHAGLPVVVFGGEHADLPLVPEKAAEIAKAVVESNISCVLDVSAFLKHTARKIVSAFLNELYRLNRAERHVFIEESDLWAMQRPIGPEEALCLSAVDNFVRRGGNHNLGCTLITQRSAVLNKDILTQSDCLVVLRTLAPQDKKAIQAWVEEQTDDDKSELNKWYDTLKMLENGEAWVWHPEKPAIFAKVKFRARETFHATREFIRSPRATKIVLMSVDEFVARFKKVFESSSVRDGVHDGLHVDTKELAKVRDENLAFRQQLEQDRGIIGDYESGKKIPGCIQDRLKFLGDVKLDLENKIKGQGEELKLYDELRSVFRRILDFQKIYDRMREFEEDIFSRTREAKVGVVPAADGDKILVTETVPEISIKVERPTVEMNESNQEGRLVALAFHGFFDEKRRSNAIAGEITRVYAVEVNLRDLNRALGSVVQKKVLQRQEAANRGWEYWLFSGAKERIKEAS
jgi:hypothetical protein